MSRKHYKMYLSYYRKSEDLFLLYCWLDLFSLMVICRQCILRIGTRLNILILLLSGFSVANFLSFFSVVVRAGIKLVGLTLKFLMVEEDSYFSSNILQTSSTFAI
ncbi:MAG: hypothetical protein EXX96DRAFT_170313 [Benjaminiella poitrasii]|nr:MAG: hypothetical protein EXX96DRAFT_170313 [Benjaminiella poitrasii]